VQWPAGLGGRGEGNGRWGCCWKEGRGEGKGASSAVAGEIGGSVDLQRNNEVGEERGGAGSDKQVGFRVVMIIYTRHRASEPFNLIQWLKLICLSGL
jgi:hypothetical protein